MCLNVGCATLSLGFRGRVTATSAAAPTSDIQAGIYKSVHTLHPIHTAETQTGRRDIFRLLMALKLSTDCVTGSLMDLGTVRSMEFWVCG